MSSIFQLYLIQAGSHQYLFPRLRGTIKEYGCKTSRRKLISILSFLILSGFSLYKCMTYILSFLILVFIDWHFVFHSLPLTRPRMNVLLVYIQIIALISLKKKDIFFFISFIFFFFTCASLCSFLQYKY